MTKAPLKPLLIQVVEHAWIAKQRKRARSPYPDRTLDGTGWLIAYRRFWVTQFDSLKHFIEKESL